MVDEVRPCRNLQASERADRFELDPQERFDAQRQARSMGREIIGHYHSHPNGSSSPSETDRSMMYEPELAWLIVAIEAGKAGGLAAYLPSPDRGDFASLELVILTPTGENSTP